MFSGDTVTLEHERRHGHVRHARTWPTASRCNVAGLTFGGTTQDGTAASVDYTLTQPTTTANITPATLTVTGITASNKVYDGTTTATLNTSGAALRGRGQRRHGVTLSTQRRDGHVRLAGRGQRHHGARWPA